MPDAVWFSTVTPGYVDKTNATTIHAALRLDDNVGAFDFGGAQRSVMGTLRTALDGDRHGPGGRIRHPHRPARQPRRGGRRRRRGGAARRRRRPRPVHRRVPRAARRRPRSSSTAGAAPGDQRSKVWEERFGETRYLPLGEHAFQAALKEADLSPDQVDHLIVTGLHARAANALANRLGVAERERRRHPAATVGNTGAAHPGLLLTGVLESAKPGKVIALVVLADGADVILLRTTDAHRVVPAGRPLDDQVDGGAPVAYGKYLAWRKMLPVEPPRRPEPARARRRPRPVAPSTGSSASSAAATGVRRAAAAAVAERQPTPQPDGRRSRHDRHVHRRPARVLARARRSSSRSSTSTAAAGCRSSSPTSSESDVALGVRVEMTFRKLFTSDGIHNYFWKARLRPRSEH